MFVPFSSYSLLLLINWLDTAGFSDLLTFILSIFFFQLFSFALSSHLLNFQVVFVLLISRKWDEGYKEVSVGISVFMKPKNSVTSMERNISFWVSNFRVTFWTKVSNICLENEENWPRTAATEWEMINTLNQILTN
jgi:hypothetical protein